MTPRLLSEEAAREYLGGVDPRKVCAPRRFGRALRWDVEDLNAVLDANPELDTFDVIARCEASEAKRREQRRPDEIIRTNALNAAPRLLHKRMKAAVSHCLNGRCKRSAWMEHCGYTLDDLMAHLEARFTEGMSWENMGQWHIDHIRPLISFDIQGVDCPQFKAAWALENLQPLWAADNLRKGGRWKP